MTDERLPLIELLPPESDITIERVPSGASSRMSTSSGQVCPKFFSFTWTLVTTLPLMPLTLITEGYGVAASVPAMTIDVVLLVSTSVLASDCEACVSPSSKAAAGNTRPKPNVRRRAALRKFIVMAIPPLSRASLACFKMQFSSC